MVSQRKKMKNVWISAATFFTFSLVLFINNFSDLTTKLNLYVPIQYICWGGLILTVFYTWYMASEDKI
ncbi:MAG TPA: hypothetical protein VI911_02530 [Patescibacteria group bacterium]|nr:hypothetical protein [Patescibacteria group bacterium]